MSSSLVSSRLQAPTVYVPHYTTILSWLLLNQCHLFSSLALSSVSGHTDLADYGARLILARIVFLQAPALRLLGIVALLHNDFLLVFGDGKTFVGRAVLELLRVLIVLPQLYEKNTSRHWMLGKIYDNELKMQRLTWLPLEPWQPYSTTSPPE